MQQQRKEGGKMRSIQLLEFGMRNLKHKNRLLRTAAQISLGIAERYANKIEKKSSRNKRDFSEWKKQRSEEVKKEIWEKISEEK